MIVYFNGYELILIYANITSIFIHKFINITTKDKEKQKQKKMM